LIGALAPDKAIVISTHILEEVDAVCSRAIVIAGGKVMIDDTPGRFAARSRHHNSVRLMLADPAVDARTALLRLPGVASVEAIEDAALRVERGKLDDVFRDITMKAA
ncbi:MAG: ABC transporter ATP-binding protein, partial [Stellaceae bacterium]